MLLDQMVLAVLEEGASVTVHAVSLRVGGDKFAVKKILDGFKARASADAARSRAIPQTSTSPSSPHSTRRRPRDDHRDHAPEDVGFRRRARTHRLSRNFSL